MKPIHILLSLFLVSCAGSQPSANPGQTSPVTCTPTGFDAAPEPSSISGMGLTKSINDFLLLSAGSDQTGGIYDGQILRIGFTPDSENNPPASEISVLINGCPITRKLSASGEEYFWNNGDTDTAIAQPAGKFFVVEATRNDKGVIYRETVKMPDVMPTLLAPTAHTVMSVPVSVRWTPMNLDGLAGKKSAALSIGGWKDIGGGGSSAGYQVLVNADGQASWSTPGAGMTSAFLQANITYENGLSFELVYQVPVN